MNAIFNQIDTTLTEIGQQVLFRKMRLLETDQSHLKQQYDLANRMQTDTALREQLQTALYPLSFLSANPLVELLFDRFPIVNLPKLFLVGWSLLSVLVIASSIYFTNGISILFAIIVIAINLFVVRNKYLAASEENAYALSCLTHVLPISQALASREFKKIPLCRRLNDNFTSIRNMKWRLRLLLFSESNNNILISYPMYLVNLLVPVDALVHAFLITSVHKNIETLRLCFTSLGELDASIALASYLRRYPRHTNPSFSRGKNLSLENAYHPLVENYVANSYKTSGESALITGSNMAGKTTFIRTIGINVLLSRTLWLCHADSALIPIMGILSSISNTDSLEEGKSYYFSELENINKFIHLSKNDEPFLLLIDEIFRGTNTVERIGGAAAVLQVLAEKNIVLVTTHDVELETFLPENYKMWNFQETGIPETPFDFKIRSGVCRTRNALKLMEAMGYPRGIIERANEIASKIDKKKKS
ncbi:MutS-related protein [Maritalea sp.]|uniref:MutS-related protein n=1 Tax=Maritalea sp. TaxID=2003361 RepID=UPI003EFAD5FE